MNYKFTPEQLEIEMNKYFFKVETQEKSFPDESGMLNFLRITDEEYEEMCRDPKYKNVLTYARRRRHSWLERQMVADNKKATGCYNALKQEENGGYVDKPVGNKERKIIVRLEGLADK